MEAATLAMQLGRTTMAVHCLCWMIWLMLEGFSQSAWSCVRGRYVSRTNSK